jgi:thiol:disulfide interchange protein DsbA
LIRGPDLPLNPETNMTINERTLPMDRRDFSRCLIGAGLALAASPSVLAQGAPVEGQHYVKLATPASTTLPPDKKVELIEFFWYGCPHCNSFEPTLEAWIKRLPPDVAFRRVHVGFGAPHQVHQRLFYALEDMGALETAHRKVFAAIHVQNKRLLTDAEISAFGSESGLDGAKLVATMKSFGVNTKAARARQLSEAYKIDGVPALGIHGRFYTSGSLAGNTDRMMQVAEFLIGRARG